MLGIAFTALIIYQTYTLYRKRRMAMDLSNEEQLVEATVQWDGYYATEFPKRIFCGVFFLKKQHIMWRWNLDFTACHHIGAPIFRCVACNIPGWKWYWRYLLWKRKSRIYVEYIFLKNHGRNIGMSALILLFGNIIGVYHLFLGVFLFVWLFVFFVIGDSYDMSDDVLASIKEK